MYRKKPSDSLLIMTQHVLPLSKKQIGYESSWPLQRPSLFASGRSKRKPASQKKKRFVKWLRLPLLKPNDCDLKRRQQSERESKRTDLQPSKRGKPGSKTRSTSVLNVSMTSRHFLMKSKNAAKLRSVICFLFFASVSMIGLFCWFKTPLILYSTLTSSLTMQFPTSKF